MAILKRTEIVCYNNIRYNVSRETVISNALRKCVIMTNDSNDKSSECVCNIIFTTISVLQRVSGYSLYCNYSDSQRISF